MKTRFRADLHFIPIVTQFCTISDNVDLSPPGSPMNTAASAQRIVNRFVPFARKLALFSLVCSWAH